MGRKTPNATKKTSAAASPDRGEATAVAIPAPPPDQGKSTAAEIPVDTRRLYGRALVTLKDLLLSTAIDSKKAANHEFTVRYGGKDYLFEAQIPYPWTMGERYTFSLVDLRLEAPDATIAMMTFPHSATRHKEDGPPMADDIFKALGESVGAGGKGVRFDCRMEGVGKPCFKMCIPSEEGQETTKGKQARTFTIKASKESALALKKPARPAAKQAYYTYPKRPISPKRRGRRIEDARQAGIMASKNVQVSPRSKSTSDSASESATPRTYIDYYPGYAPKPTGDALKAPPLVSSGAKIHAFAVPLAAPEIELFMDNFADDEEDEIPLDTPTMHRVFPSTVMEYFIGLELDYVYAAEVAVPIGDNVFAKMIAVVFATNKDAEAMETWKDREPLEGLQRQLGLPEVDAGWYEVTDDDLHILDEEERYELREQVGASCGLVF
ncbi:hypothetical protein D9611_006699 [Ephemerocybe angulata]|uniref:Uncharacterized protein n=1 Tax=Ephemerocybe angulata TaxID=980116 RepID=A0A8H5FGX0_9AGAR|nr:hypothetical protein D9611_006699 [Tulosesus angulatus]